MAIDRIVDRLVRYAEGLYHRRWEQRELLALGLAVLLVLIMAIRSRRKAAADTKHVLTERTPDKRLQKLE